ncbi:DNA-directed RNA polymerase subunit alpha C-terminal domain-containing protein [Phytobacter diazotrophicus]|uniref:DNA-directed RNA polymerase subunit alpha C-terminal domain-containing protein n=1 Tax=Phytobacter diazotrophicus TaxID=395631 RepID=UPI002935910A|nr:DNA-directed RNA polymerase subunit alpha C-terminal domain-containing protein [Phytobacter diazotrophicus]MDV2876651.1 DNA-directed RNA polymerase subunit alpha C-terminal domain-containing protein [Phytobacter diazotrophicus]
MKNETVFIVTCGNDVERQKRTEILRAILMIKGVVGAIEVGNEHATKLPDLDVLQLTTRVRNGLHAAGIETTSQLLTYSEIDLLKMQWFGRKSVTEIIDVLANHGLSLRDCRLRW